MPRNRRASVPQAETFTRPAASRDGLTHQAKGQIAMVKKPVIQCKGNVTAQIATVPSDVVPHLMISMLAARCIISLSAVADREHILFAVLSK